MFQLTPGTYTTSADLPVELVIHIVSFAIQTNLKEAKRTYRSLVRVSSQMQEIAHAVCLPQFPIMLRTRESLYSFHALLENHPTAGSSVRNLWFFPNRWSLEDQQIKGYILFACPRLERLACGITLLKVLIQNPPPFRHDRLRDLTIVSNMFAPREPYPNSFGSTLFSQLTHFRSISRRYFDDLPFVFSSLTHVSFSCRPSYHSDLRATFDSTQFPALLHIVATVPHILRQFENSHTLRANARMWDNRMELIACPKKWDESEVWEMAGRWGQPSIWERAPSGDDIGQ